jgi:hypothetical protein
MEAGGRKIGVGLTLALVLAAAAAFASGDADEDWVRIGAGEKPVAGSIGEVALRNHGALGRLLVVVRTREGAPAAPLEECVASAMRFLEGSKLDYVVALRHSAWLVFGKPAREPSIEVIETDGSRAVSIPLPAKDEEIADKLRGRLYRRADPDPAARFDASVGMEGGLDFVLAPPEGWRVADLGDSRCSLCVLEGPEGRRAYLGAEPLTVGLGEAEASVRAKLEGGEWGRHEHAQKLSKPQHADSKAASGAFKATFETEKGEKGGGHFELVKKSGVLWAVVLGGKVPEKEASALLALLKQGAKK